MSQLINVMMETDGSTSTDDLMPSKRGFTYIEIESSAHAAHAA